MRRDVEGPDHRVPVEVGEVGGGDAEEGAVQARVEAREALVVEDVADGVQGGVVVGVAGG